MQLKEVLIKNDFHFKKKFGQNFITDKNLLDKIVDSAGVTEQDTVVEVGVGGGTLTEALAKRCKRVVGYEIDKTLEPILNETLAAYDNVSIVFGDVMKIDTSSIEENIGEEYKLVANLPYYITTPILMKFIDEAEKLKSVSVTVQDEVADRLCAAAGTENYGAITAAIDAVGNAKKVLYIDRRNFYPIPNVDSALVRIDIDRNKYDIPDRSMYRAAVRCAFLSRRKTLVNNLMLSFGFSRQKAEEIVAAIGKDKLVRGETLTTEDFIKLSEQLNK